MEPKKLYMPIRIVSFVVLALIAVAILYAGAISVLNWTGIGV